MSEENTKTDSAASAEAAVQEQAAPDAQELQLQLEDARSKADEHWNQVLRLQAELENNRRRAERDVENAHKYALDRFTQDLLPVRDSLELALAAIGPDSALDRLREGTELTLKMLTQAMEKYGIREVNPVGQPFNPEQHQAMSMQESTEVAPNCVLAVMQKGYTLNDRLVRPALVVVAKAPATG
ncbi:nucleotide exchange factor GrpE [Sulfurivermis fontis]|uniref:nucleotide exchange factor GrpE n=1 Tax=Sulfurivermis fontis TaxID=1972068 RepID=UPI000FD8F2DE